MAAETIRAEALLRDIYEAAAELPAPASLDDLHISKVNVPG